VLVDDEAKQATVIVPDDQLSLAIGREGQNARLAARLTGWRIDIKSETEFATEDRGGDEDGEEGLDGRCHAILANGRRCPNASLPSSRYCGLFAHQALVDYDTDDVTVLTADDDEEPGEDVEVETIEDAAEEDVQAEAEAAEESLVDIETARAEEAAAVPADGLEPAPESAEPTGEADDS
jgi:N utilization substance protein A